MRSGIWKGIYRAMFICWMECLEMMPSWCGQWNWGNCGTAWLNCTVLSERRLERTVLRPALLPVKTAQFTQFFCQAWRLLLILQCFDRLVAFHFPSVIVASHYFPCCMTSHTKIAQFNWECIGRLWKTVKRSRVPTSLPLHRTEYSSRHFVFKNSSLVPLLQAKSRLISTNVCLVQIFPSL